MADFCIYLELCYTEDKTTKEDIDRLYERPDRTEINHTDFGPLTDFPLALSINTRGSRLDLVRWESARWACLQNLLTVCTARKSESRDKPNLPEFLPAIVVHEGKWNLVVTTYKDKKTTLWHQIEMGSTVSVQGIYQIIACLHLLRQWAEGVFWPWFSDLVSSSRPYRKRWGYCLTPYRRRRRPRSLTTGSDTEDSDTTDND